MEARHKDEGLVLLAIDLDEPGGRPKIPGFLKKHGLHVQVLLGDSESLKGFDTRVASSLYLIDRKGFLAGIPSEFYAKLEKTVEARLPDLLRGKPTPGPLLWAVEEAPPGFGVLWRQGGELSVNLLAVAPGTKERPAEIGVGDETHLRRYSAAGELLGEAPIEAEKLGTLLGADLDGDGKNEWIAGGDEEIRLMDGAGEAYWSYGSARKPLEIVGFADLDRDGTREILIREGSSMVAKKALPGNLWRTDSLGTVRSAVPDPAGALLVQTEEGIRAVDRSGHVQGAAIPIRGGYFLKGRIDSGEGRSLDVLGPRYWAGVDVEHDLDGDGRKDILVSTVGGVMVFSQAGTPLLVLRVANNQVGPLPVLADLDGRPGDELIVAIPDYGLVALGISPRAKPVAGASAVEEAHGAGKR